MSSTTNTKDSIRRFAALLERKPLGMSSIEEAQQFLSDMGVSCNLACGLSEHEHCLQVRVGSVSAPELKGHFSGADIPIPLNQTDENRWEGRLRFPWEEFFLLLTSDERTAKVPIYGPCSAALTNNIILDESVPVVTLYELGAAVVEVMTGAPIQASGFCSERNEAIHTAQEAARILMAASNNDTNGQRVPGHL